MLRLDLNTHLFLATILFLNRDPYGNVAYADVANYWQFGFQTPATPYMEGLVCFYNWVMFFVILIVIFTSWLLCRCLVLYLVNSFKLRRSPQTVISTVRSFRSKQVKRFIQHGLFTHCTLLEILWSTIPVCILIVIIIPSFSLLYRLNVEYNTTLTVKAIGHQWYWSYVYTDVPSIISTPRSIRVKRFDSYMVPTDTLKKGRFRLLETDNRVVLPVRKWVRMIISSADVLHSWAVPSLGIKVDACPGRLNQIFVYVTRRGHFYGQCSEICGAYHGFMPILVVSKKLSSFNRFILSSKYVL